jgi:hypothetical protein
LHPPRFCLCIASTCAVLAAACGGGSEASKELSGPGTTATSRATVTSSSVEKANVICREAHERIAEGLKRVPEIVDEAHVRPEQVKRTAAAAAEYVLPAYRAALARLKAVEPPTDRRAEWTRFLRALDAFVAYSTENLAVLEKTGSVAGRQRAIRDRDALLGEIIAAAIRARVPYCSFS